MLRAGDPPESLQRLFEFLRLPAHTQERISATAFGDEPAILLVANSHRMVGLYAQEAVPPMVRSILDAGTCLFLTWAEAPPALREQFDVVLYLDGTGPEQWREASLRCEQGIGSGPLASGKVCRLVDLAPVKRILEKALPAAPAQ
jgi:hypothetical protein